MHIVDVSEIIYCKSDNSYTTFYLVNEREVLVSKSIKEYAEMLEEFDFGFYFSGKLVVDKHKSLNKIGHGKYEIVLKYFFPNMS